MWFSPTAPTRKSHCVLNTMSYTPLCQCVTFSKMDDHNTIFIPHPYIHHPFCLSRPTEQGKKDILLCTAFLLFPSGNQKERPFSDFTTSSKSCSTNRTSQDSTLLESFENKSLNCENEERQLRTGWEIRDSGIFDFWVFHYITNSCCAGSHLFTFKALRSGFVRVL